MSRSGRQSFEFGGHVRLEVDGGSRDLGHARAVYGAAAPAPAAPPHARVSFGRPAGEANGTTIEGSHKTVGWRVRLGDPAAEPLTAEIALRGRPRWFCRSLVQGYFVEPLLALAAAREGRVLLPGAAYARDGAAVVLIGRSGSGKSTVMARLAADGVPVLGDDHVVLDGSGVCWPFPRRVRLYPDIRETAPRAYRALPRRRRSGLLGRAAAQRLSAGRVAPPVVLPAAELATTAASPPLRVGSVFVVRRDDGAERAERDPIELEEALAEAAEVLALQRAALADAGTAWREALARAAEAERSTLANALANARLERLRVPNRLPAADAIAALHERLAAA